MASDIITPERLRDVLSYDPLTGDFRWKITKARGRVGQIAGGICKPLGYVQIVIGQRHYYGHRLAWLHIHGEWPSGQIDHMNGVRHDNRLANLRDVSLAVNRQNLRAAKTDSTHGFLGVIRRGSKWRARLTVDKQTVHLGTYDTAEEAHAAYLEAKRRLHAGCTI